MGFIGYGVGNSEMNNPPPPTLTPEKPSGETVEELTNALSESLARERKLRAEVEGMRRLLNRSQGLVQSALGNVGRVAKELQEYLQSGRLPE